MSTMEIFSFSYNHGSRRRDLHSKEREGVSYLIVFSNAETEVIFLTFDTKLLVNFIFNRKSVTIPSETSGHMMPSRAGKSGNHVFDGSSKNVTVVGKACCKRGAIIKHIFRATLASPQLLFECIGPFPIFEDRLFLSIG